MTETIKKTETAEAVETIEKKKPSEKRWMAIFKQCKEDGTAEFPGPSLTSGDEGMLGGGSHAVGVGYWCALGTKEQCSAKICPKITHSADKKKITASIINKEGSKQIKADKS